MLRDITFGQYYSADSIIHKMDPRMKMILMILMIVIIFVASNFYALSFIGLVVALLLVLSKVPLKLYLKNFKAILPVLIFTSAINVFYGETYLEGALRALFMALRIIMLIFMSSSLTYTTTPNDLTDGIESLLSPLKFIGLGSVVHTLAMMMTIALRFIPTLIEEAEKIMNAQKARGADLESGNLIEKVKALIPILIPLLISSVRRAYELAEAMECRCYNGGEGRTRMKQMHIKANDILVSLFCVLVLGIVILLNIIF